MLSSSWCRRILLSRTPIVGGSSSSSSSLRRGLAGHCCEFQRSTSLRFVQQTPTQSFLASTTRSASSSAPTRGGGGDDNDDDDPTAGLDDPALRENLQWSPPPVLTTDMAHGIAEATHFYVRHGLSSRRLKALSQQSDTLEVVEQWQKMMEIFLTTQVHVIAGMGYGASEQGLTQYAQDLANCLAGADDEVSEELRDVRRDTWRALVATTFNLELDEIPTLSVVDARNLMHKLSSKMIEPDILMEIQTRASQISDPNPELEVAHKHNVLQQIIVNQVYLGGNPSIAEEAGFGTGRTAYAKLQCAMSDHEADPLISQYAAAAMMRMWQAAGLDMSQLQGAFGGKT